MSVAAVQKHLRASDDIDKVEVNSYLSELCSSLGGSMIGESQPIDVEVKSDNGMIASDDAVGIGLIVTELLINAIKYAFPSSRIGAQIRVIYEVDGTDWKLVVTDKRRRQEPDHGRRQSGGLGTAIVEALVKQLHATMAITTSARGTDGRHHPRRLRLEPAPRGPEFFAFYCGLVGAHGLEPWTR